MFRLPAALRVATLVDVVDRADFADFADTQPDPAHADAPLVVRAPRDYQAAALAAADDTELLLAAILPRARVAHVGASAVPGAYSRGEADLAVAVEPDAWHETLAVLAEAGYERRRDASTSAGEMVLGSPDGAPGVRLRVVASRLVIDALLRFRDALRDDAALLARYNARRLEAAPRGQAAYDAAKSAFVTEALAGLAQRRDLR